jgi:uncharacterized protein (TIRG00374 family)
MDGTRRGRRLDYRFWLGIAVSVVCLVLVLRGARWGEVWTALQSVWWPFILLGQLFFISNLVLRAVRWRALLLPVGRLSLFDVFAYLMIGYVANNVMPFKLGEFVRAVLLGENRHMAKSGILATILVERLLDILALLLFIVVLSFAIEIPPVFRQGIFVVEGIACVILLVLWLFSLSEATEAWLDRLIPCFAPQLLRDRVRGVALSFSGGLQGLRGAGRMPLLLVYSALVWGLTALNVACVLRAFRLASLPWYASLLVVTLANLGTMLPSSPGSLGVAHFFLTTSLTILSVDHNTALGFALVHHSVLLVVTAGLGLVFLVHENIALGRLSGPGCG